MKKETKKKIFRTSQPYGYYMPDVDNAIEKYNEALDELKAVIIDQKTKIQQLEADNSKLEHEVKEMTLQMTMTYVPDMAASTEHMIMDQFNTAMGRSRTDHDLVDPKDFGEEPKEKEPSFEDLGMPNIDDLIIKAKPLKTKKKTTSFDDLEIIK